MTGVMAAVRYDDGGAARRASSTAVVLLLALAVAWMHTLAGAPLPTGGHAAAVSGMVEIGPGHCHMADHGGPCPGTTHDDGHAGAMCESTAATSTVLPVPVLTGGVAAAAPHGPAQLDTTVAVDAAAGTGCGPPSLSMLALLRI